VAAIGEGVWINIISIKSNNEVIFMATIFNFMAFPQFYSLHFVKAVLNGIHIFTQLYFAWVLAICLSIENYLAARAVSPDPCFWWLRTVVETLFWLHPWYCTITIVEPLYNNINQQIWMICRLEETGLIGVQLRQIPLVRPMTTESSRGSDKSPNE